MVPMKYKGLGFDRYKGDAYNEKAAEMAKGLMKDTDKDGYFYGGPGTGKSMLAAVLANEKMKSGTEVQFVSTGDFLRELSGVADSNSRSKVLDAVTDVPFLVLDDFGAKPVNENGSKEILKLLKKRVEKGFQTVISSGYKPDEVAARFTQPAADEISEMIKSRALIVELK